VKPWCAAALLAACAHATPPARPPPADLQAVVSGGVEVQDAIHGVRYQLVPGPEAWQLSRDGDAREGNVEAEVTSFPLARPGSPAQCRDYARARGAAFKDAEGPRDDELGEPATWSFTIGPAAAPQRNRSAFFARGADCVVLHVASPRRDAFADEAFAAAARSFVVLPLPDERQREVDILAGMRFLEQHDPAAALERFEALSQREPNLEKAHFGALMAGFEVGASAYARALPHGKRALAADRDLTPEQRQLALRAVGVMQLAQNELKQAAETLAELVVRAPDLAEGQYNYACALARLGDAKGALDHLQAAVRLDGELVQNARDDDDLKSLRGSRAFEDLVNPRK
jgi:tetratricopeptide (TPR) repeat protein